VQKRLTAECHHGFDVVLSRNLSHRICGNLRIDPFSTGSVISLRTVLTPPCAGIGHNEFYLIEIFKKFVSQFISPFRIRPRIC
jgi:hypothetical protein